MRAGVYFVSDRPPTDARGLAVLSRTTRRFRKAYRALPAEVRRRAKLAFTAWRSDPWNPALRFKKIHGTEPVFSVRIGVNWRAVARVEGDRAVWFWIGSHAEYDKLLKR